MGAFADLDKVLSAVVSEGCGPAEVECEQKWYANHEKSIKRHSNTKVPHKKVINILFIKARTYSLFAASAAQTP